MKNLHYFEEPQIGFRSTSKLEFDENYYYGSRPKIELLQRLQIIDLWGSVSATVPNYLYGFPTRAKHYFNYKFSGGIIRLAANVNNKSTIDSKINLNKRTMDRDTAIYRQLRKFLLNSGDQLKNYSSTSIYNLEKKYNPNIDQKEIDDILSKNFVSVIDKIPTTEIPGYKSINDYLSYAPYWWPNPDTANGLPFVWKDGLWRKECILFGEESYTNDRSSLQLLFDRLTKLSLSYKSSKDPKVLEYICSQIFHWFIDEDSKMNPNLEFAQTKRGIIGSNSKGIIDFKDIYYFLGAIKLIEKDIKEKYTSIYEKFTYWLVEYKLWLINSDTARKASSSTNNHGTCFFLQRGAIEEFLKNKNELFDTYILTNLLILNSIDKEGKQPEELARTLTKHYCTFNLQQFLNLNYIFINSIKQSFFDNQDEDNRLILAIKWLYKERSNWRYEQIKEFNEDRIDVLLHIAKDQSTLINELIPNDSIKPIESLPDNFENEAGIPLYWKNTLQNNE